VCPVLVLVLVLLRAGLWFVGASDLFVHQAMVRSPAMVIANSPGRAVFELAVMLVMVWFVGAPTLTWVVSGRAPFQYDIAAQSIYGYDAHLFAAEAVAFAVCAAVSFVLTALAADRQLRLAGMAVGARSTCGCGRECSHEAESCISPASWDLRAAEVSPHDAPPATRREKHSSCSQHRSGSRQRLKGRESGHHVQGRTQPSRETPLRSRSSGIYDSTPGLM